MKNKSLFTTVAVASAAVLVFSACKPEASTAVQSGSSAERTSFKEVTSQLDAGGNFYLYLGTEQWVQGLSGKVAKWRDFLGSMPGVSGGDTATIGRALDLVTNLIKDSGLEDISGFGMSSVAREKGFYRTKALLHHYPGQGNGFFWTMLGSKPHALDGLKLLPESTAFASFSDLDLPVLWTVLQKEARQSGLEQAEQLFQQFPEQFEARTGMNWNKLMASLGGEFGFVLTLDEKRMVALPIPGQDGGGMEIPEPALMLVAKVKDDTLFNRLDEALKALGQNVVNGDKPGLKMRTLPVPLPLPISLRPTIASSGGYLFIASTDALVQEALAVKAGQKQGLTGTAEFKRLAAGVPEQGNHFNFLSTRFGQAIRGLQERALANAPKLSSEQKDTLHGLLAGPADCGYNVGGCTEQGWLSVGNGSQSAGKMVLVCAAVPAMLSAVAIPNFIKARETAQKNACINNLRQIDGAKQTWALEKKKPEDATPTWAELAPYLGHEKKLSCPAGGTYTINAVKDVPQCSHQGHQLPQL